MQMLTWSETTLEGARPFAGTLTQPKTVKNYYQDIAVLAFPTPAGETARMAEHAPRITYGVEPRNFDAANLLDGNPATAAIVPLAGTSLTQYLNLDFPEPLTAQSLTVGLDVWNTAIPAALEVSVDGQHYEMVREFTARWPVASVNFPQVTARHFRIQFTILDPAGDWVFNRFAKGIPLSEVELQPTRKIEDISGKAFFMRQEDFSNEPAGSPDWVVPQGHIVDLSSKMDSAGSPGMFPPASGRFCASGTPRRERPIIPRLSKALASNATSSASEPSRCSSPIFCKNCWTIRPPWGGIL